MQLSSRAKLLVKSNCAAILRVQDKGGSSGRWPMPVLKSTNEASIYSEPVLAKTLYNHINYFLSRGYSIKEVADFFPYPSPVARLMMIFRSRVIWDLNRNQYIQLANWLADILFYHFKKDYFCYHGKNILLSPDDVEKLVRLNIIILIRL